MLDPILVHFTVYLENCEAPPSGPVAPSPRFSAAGASGGSRGSARGPAHVDDEDDIGGLEDAGDISISAAEMRACTATLLQTLGHLHEEPSSAEGSAASALLPTTAASPEKSDVALQGTEGEEEGELEYLNDALQQHTASLPEMDPPAMVSAVLRPYQKQALHWMCQRESLSSVDDMALHPQWRTFKSPSGAPFYWQ